MVAATFTARPWLAQQMECRAEDLAMPGHAVPMLDGGMSGSYVQAGRDAVQLFLSRERGGVHEPAYRVVMAWLPGGERVVRIGAEDRFVW